jgi:hypothetical protein
MSLCPDVPNPNPNQQQARNDADLPQCRHSTNKRGVGMAEEPKATTETAQRETIGSGNPGRHGQLQDVTTQRRHRRSALMSRVSDDSSNEYYSKEYLALGLPDPRSDAGEKLLRSNTNGNVDSFMAAQVERLILSDRSNAVQLATIDSSDELKTWEDHQQFLLAQNAKRAVTLAAALEQRFAKEDAQLVKDAFMARRRDEQSVDQCSSAKWFQMISGSSQWVAKPQPVQRVHKRPREEQGQRPADLVVPLQVPSDHAPADKHRQRYKNMNRRQRRTQAKERERAQNPTIVDNPPA